MHDSQIPAGSLPPTTRLLAEALLEQVDLAVGACKLTLVSQDGQLRYMLREEKIGASALHRFDQEGGSRG